MTRTPTAITVRRKTTLHFSPLKFQFYDSRGRQRPEERFTLKTKQQGDKPFNDDADLESNPPIPESPSNIPTNAHRKRRCYGIQSVAERKERRRAIRARGKQNAESDRSGGEQNFATVKSKCRGQNDDGADDDCLDENSVEEDTSLSIKHSEKLVQGSNESTSDSEKESEHSDDDHSPVKQRRLFAIAKKRRFILEEESTDDEVLDGGAEKNDDEFVFDQDEVERIKSEKDDKGRRNVAKNLRGKMTSTASTYEILTRKSDVSKTRMTASIANSANPSSSEENASKKNQTKVKTKPSNLKSNTLQNQPASIIGKSAIAKSPYAPEMYAKTAAATLTDESNNTRVNHRLLKEVTRSQKTTVTATELSSKRQKLSANFDIEEDTAVESSNEETGDETPDSDDDASEYESSINLVDAEHQSSLTDKSVKKAKPSKLHVRMNRNYRRNKNNVQNAGRGCHDSVFDNVSTNRKRQGSNVNTAKLSSPCPHDLKKSVLDHVPIRDNSSVDVERQEVKGGKDQTLEDKPWGAADRAALVDEKLNNGGFTPTRNVTVNTQKKDNGASVEEEDMSDKQDVKQGLIGANKTAAAEAAAKAMSFVEFNTRYISTADKGIILAEIQNEDDSPTTPSQGQASDAKIPLSTVSLSNEKPKSSSDFVKEANALDIVRSRIVVKLTKKIKAVNEVAKQLGLMMEEVHMLASSARLTYGRDQN